MLNALRPLVEDCEVAALKAAIAETGATWAENDWEWLLLREGYVEASIKKIGRTELAALREALPIAHAKAEVAEQRISWEGASHNVLGTVAAEKHIAQVKPEVAPVPVVWSEPVADMDGVAVSRCLRAIHAGGPIPQFRGSIGEKGYLIGYADKARRYCGASGRVRLSPDAPTAKEAPPCQSASSAP